jgi:hypothetical protein
LFWPGLGRFLKQKHARPAKAHAAVQATAEVEKVAGAKKSKNIQKHAVALDVPPAKVKLAVAEKKVAVEKDRKKAPERVAARDMQQTTKAKKQVEPVVKSVREEKLATSAKSVPQKENAEVSSREIEKDEGVVLARETYAAPDEAAPFAVQGFDTSRYASRADHDDSGGVMVEEPITAVSLESDKTVAAESKSPASAAKKPDPEKAGSEDWLNGHLDLLNKLK